MWNENRNDPLAAGTSVKLESPLVGAQDLLKVNAALQSKAFRLYERPFLELVNLRGDPRDEAFMAAVQAALGTRVPVAPNTVARGTECDVLWLGPDEWLVRSSEARATQLEAKLAAAVAGMFACAVDVGSGYTVLEASGDKVRDVLARGCPLDLHPAVLPLGRCVQSHYFKASIVLMPTADNTFEIVVRRSFADYFCRIMLDAAAPLAD
ncbi:sarcosine oxidase subunit gamma [Trinickia caryophylli]|uniref:Sarcosine oxidase subunit gamma n=1 Tax=Trinickia caryophylli TaxID=28094 RepID=A0A1X7E7D8_TRICW|nr:sarcosine oxidase subunit gamma [Trinickia caryophylli]PMS13113.1 sarcosine oxidase subunit gamma [Trinickia caryophylli]TRX14823.1 sarcosine oxidase subunit gamma [Trinickia caryophylli]WQE14673.1 sarcosine oxidase subunit gamma [Trinickia caryophylli]SMF28871.1 sarcosine oxidase subunit gamma [Trinickia caryophylli]GLU31905.1 sarcosine oxidase subunit gamma [Trinickia caryophylli]